ncbi:MAG: polyprenyl synthetase family protein [Jatrophihabitantaceae bacterium]
MPVRADEPAQGSTVADVLDIADLRWRVNEQLKAFLATKTAACAPGEVGGTLLTPAVSLVLGRGKRLRAALCYWAWRGAGGPDGESVIVAASALELLHGCALIHDDVMDDSAIRRGQPAAHRQFASAHAVNGWRGRADQFGIAAAILAGDLCLIWADEMLSSSGLSGDRLLRARAVYDAMRQQTVLGQYLDLSTQAARSTRPSDAWRVARDKTAANTTCGPLAFGAALVGAAPDTCAAYAAYADPLGVAFQLHDDLLGAFGEPAVTGKPSGDDLRDGKCTVLLTQARQMGGPRVAARIDELLESSTSDAVGELRELLDSCGARAYVETQVRQLGHQAGRALDDSPVDPEARDVLQQLAIGLTTLS